MKLNKKGFTLIELIVVIAIIATLLLILVPTMNGFVDTAKKEKDLANARAIYSAAKAQQTAYKVGLCDTDVEDGTTALDDDFFSGAFPDGCTIAVSDEDITVTCNGQTYPESGN